MEQSQIDHTIERLQKRLEEKAMNKPCNEAVKTGYTEAIEVLQSKKTDYKDIQAKNIQSRAIVALTMDYLRAEDILCSVPIKTN